ncbi:MAG: GTPase [Lachnospiraceae bacterium]|nr:GTPase [Lachnospiraceae bacterium]
MMEIPVYFISGFLESGKTTFINNTLRDPYFLEDKPKTLLIVCEEGFSEYDEKALADLNVSVVYAEDEEAFGPDYFKKLQDTYKPRRVLIEFNGTWSVSSFVDKGMPRNWVMAQMISLINAQTFESYLSNMRQFMNEQMMFTELVIFNRCNVNTKKQSLRKAVKAVNRGAQVVYDFVDGSDGSNEEDDLPYNINADIIEIEDDDYGIFYLDAADNPKKYDGKTVKFKGMIYKDRKFKGNDFVPGRLCMTCCANDVAFVGFVCRGNLGMLKHKDWAVITAKIHVEYDKDYEGDAPFLDLINISASSKPAEEMVYMF